MGRGGDTEVSDLGLRMGEIRATGFGMPAHRSAGGPAATSREQTGSLLCSMSEVSVGSLAQNGV